METPEVTYLLHTSDHSDSVAQPSTVQGLPLNSPISRFRAIIRRSLHCLQKCDTWHMRLWNNKPDFAVRINDSNVLVSHSLSVHLSPSMPGRLPSFIWNSGSLFTWGSTPQNWASPSLKTRLLLGSPCFLFILSFTESLNVSWVLAVARNMGYTIVNKIGMVITLPKPSALLDVRV